VLSCNAIESTFMSVTPPDLALCEECGFVDVLEDRWLHAVVSGVDSV
jgi:hypothetical protein